MYRGDTAHEVNIYIAESLEDKLNSTVPGVREGALSSVCKRFREAYKAKFGAEPGFIEPQYLELTRLRPKTAITILSAEKPEEPVVTVPTVQDEPECDECFNCDELNDHHKCSGRNGCPLAVPWPR